LRARKFTTWTTHIAQNCSILYAKTVFQNNIADLSKSIMSEGASVIFIAETKGAQCLILSLWVAE